MGVFEWPAFAKGTNAVAAEMARCTAAGATTIVGGGDSVAAVAQAGLQVSSSLGTEMTALRARSQWLNMSGPHAHRGRGQFCGRCRPGPACR